MSERHDPGRDEELEARLRRWFADRSEPWAPDSLRDELERVVMSGGGRPTTSVAAAWRRWWVVAVAAAVLLAFGGVAAARLVIAPAGRVPSPSPGGTVAPATTPTAVASPATTPMASPVATPMPTAKPVAFEPLAGWSANVIDDSTQGMQVLGWSSDGSMLAVTGGHDVPPDTVHVFDRTGTLLRTVPGVTGMWIGPGDLLVVSGTDPAHPTGPTWVRSIPAGHDREVSVPDGFTPVFAAAGGWYSGTVGTGTQARAFVLIRNAQVTAPITGVALALSGDGRKLAHLVDAAPGDGMNDQGDLRLLDIETLTSADLHVQAMEFGATLNRDGSLAAACVVGIGTIDPCVMALIDTSSEAIAGTSSMLAPECCAAWTSDDRYRFSPAGISALGAWRPGGQPEPDGWFLPEGTTLDRLVVSGGLTVAFIDGPGLDTRPMRAAADVALISLGANGPLLDRIAAVHGREVAFVRSPHEGYPQEVELVVGILPALTQP
jgi:hypothetical protein